MADAPDDPCSWETAHDSIRLFYSAGETAVNWEDAVLGDGSIGHADTLEVWVHEGE